MQIEILVGKEVTKHIDDFAALRLSFFREYPYFYEADEPYEKRYLSNYASSKHSLFAVAKQDGKIVGVLTGGPLNEALPEIQQPFLDKKKPLESIFYLGELVLEKGHERVQSQMYELFEQQIRKEGRYQQIALYEVTRPKREHEAPQDYVSTEEFWKKMGFAQHPEIALHIEWKEIHSAHKIPHTLIAWIKELK